MEENQNIPRPFTILLQATTYLMGGMFLLNISTSLGGRVAQAGQIFGYIFIGVGVCLGIAACVGRFLAWASRVARWFLLGLFYVSLANLIVVAVGSSKYRSFFVVLVLAFLCIVIAALLIHRFGMEVSLRTRLRSRAAWAWLLRRLSVALSLVALSMVILQVNVIGGPILYLAISLVCIGVASLL